MAEENGHRDNVEPPSKRRRLSCDEEHVTEASTSVAVPSSMPVNKETEVGIQAYANSTVTRFVGILKTRYSDFIVNEILPNSEVVHLRNTRAPKQKHQQNEEETHPGVQEPLIAPAQSESARLLQNDIQPSAEEEKKSSEEAITVDDQISDEQREQLLKYFNETTASELITLYQSIKRNPRIKANQHPNVRTEFTSDRSIRSQIHQFVRETFKSSIDSSTDHDGTLVLTAARGNGRDKRQAPVKDGRTNPERQRGKLSWLDRGGEYVHFTLYKENKDTMEAISWLTRQLKCNAKIFQFAGTKDRRAVTTQRCSAYRIEAERLAAQNQTLRGSKIGDFVYHHQGLELGDLGGNEFVITLRDCQLPSYDAGGLDLATVQQDVQQRMRSLRDNGYLNYYGEQRFGTFSVRTDVIGKHMLKEDYGTACDAILSFQPDALEAAQAPDQTSTIGQDDKNRALAIHKWRTENSLHAALDILPRRFSAETQIMRHLTKQPSDKLGALMTISRNLRLMYVHAYQSLVWNLAVTQRMKLYGNKVVKGDLVLVNEHKDKTAPQNGNGDMATTVDADGEEIIEPAGHDQAAQKDDVFERARALTEDEAHSGSYSIFDIVLPQPGYDILYPDNESGEFYKSFMTSDEGGSLNPYNMRRKQKDFSLSGAYRKMLARIGADFDVSVHSYEHNDEQFVKTDLDLIKEQGSRSGDAQDRSDHLVKQEQPNKNGDHGSKIAIVLKFQLGPSQYATMALRELSRGGIAAYKPDFSGGR